MNADISNQKKNDCNKVHYIIELLANIINYLNVSLYQGQFTYYHEQAFARLNELYEQLSKQPCIAPSIDDINEFYNNIMYLKNVTDTDDPNYYCYLRSLKKYILK
jgi:hypothetical protein